MMRSNQIFEPVKNETFDDSDVPNVDYFREYVIPTLADRKSSVIVQTFPNYEEFDMTQETRISDRSVIIPKDKYETLQSFGKLDEGKLIEYCKKYVDYDADTFNVISLLESNINSAKIKFTRYDRSKKMSANGAWIANTEIYMVRTEDSLRREREERSAERKFRRDNA